PSCAATSSAQVTCSNAPRTPGTYVAGDFHNHTTCSDGSISMQKLVKKATDTVDTPWGLDWFVQAGHGGNGNRNCQLVEDATLSTPAYPFVAGFSGPRAEVRGGFDRTTVDLSYDDGVDSLSADDHKDGFNLGAEVGYDAL